MYTEEIKSISSLIILGRGGYTGIGDILHGVLAGHKWLIHSEYHAAIIEYSLNRNEYLEHYTHESMCQLVADKGIEGLNQASAYSAMAQDIHDEIKTREIEALKNQGTKELNNQRNNH